MTMLKIFFAYNLNQTRSDWGEGDGYDIYNKVLSFMNQVVKGSKFNSVDYFVNPTQGEVSDTDILVYMLESMRSSYIRKAYPSYAKGSQLGATWNNPGKGMIIEVYVTAHSSGPTRNDNIVNTIFHEIMHSRLDSVPGKPIVSSIHNISGASCAKASGNASNIPNNIDISFLKKGINQKIPPWKDGLGTIFYGS